MTDDSRALVLSFWSAMHANDWRRAADFLAPGCVIDWPCSGERITGRDDFVAIQERYPTATGRWSFDVHRVVADGSTVVSEVTVTDGEQTARVVVSTHSALVRATAALDAARATGDPFPRWFALHLEVNAQPPRGRGGRRRIRRLRRRQEGWLHT